MGGTNSCSSHVGLARRTSTPAPGGWTRTKLPRLLGATGLVALLVGAPGALARYAGYQPAFRTPGGNIYCQLGFAKVLQLRCFRPKDGFWIQLSAPGRSARVSKGYDPRVRGFHPRGFQLLNFGRVWSSSDASIFTCWSGRTALTCEQYDGLSISLGARGGYRIFIDAPGLRPEVRPLLRTGSDVRCGIALATHVPENPYLLCWQASNGLELGLAHDTAGGTADYSRREKDRDYRPPGFRLLRAGHSIAWRCKRVGVHFAEQCSTTKGTAVFVCTNTAARLTCTNRKRHGFWVSRTSFYPF